MRVLITCPPMIGMRDQFASIFKEKGIEVFIPEVVQTLSVSELIQLVPNYDGWIIGDDPATRDVFKAGSEGKLKAAVKWGVGVDNIDFDACKDYNIAITNTPNMFGAEAADVAVAYLIGLARNLFFIDREIRNNNWEKKRGVSLAGKKVGLIGFGDVGRHVVKRLVALGMDLIIYAGPCSDFNSSNEYEFSEWPVRISECDFLVFACSLNKENHHMLNDTVLSQTKEHVSIINIARGALIDEAALVRGLQSGHVRSVALDVFEEEPLPTNSPLRSMDYCIFGSHNSSNTEEAVRATNMRVIDELFRLLGVQ